MVNEDATIPLPCPGCGEKTEKSVRWFKTNPDSFVCSGCGETVHLNPEDIAQVNAMFNQVDDALSDLSPTFDEINKRQNRP